MDSIITAIAGIYIFIFMGFIAKMSLKQQIDDKTITLINIYFLQVFLTFWGLLLQPVNIDFLFAPLAYFVIISVVLFFTITTAKIFFKDKKERSIATIAAIIGNTGNLGIPINIAIFGTASIPYTTVVNLVNVIIVYTFGVYYYSRGSFTIKNSLINILKLPILWAVIAAVMLSVGGYRPSKVVEGTLMMGAYASMTMQLFLFGIYLYGTKIKEINKVLLSYVSAVKFIVLPFVAFIILYLLHLPNIVKDVIFIELMMPLAVANVNLSSLYECSPKVVTVLVFVTSLLFLGTIFATIRIVHFL